MRVYSKLTLSSFITRGLQYVPGALYPCNSALLDSSRPSLYPPKFMLYLTASPSPVSLALGITKNPPLINLDTLVLVAGSLSLSDYTTIPLIQVEAVLMEGWLSQGVFNDLIAIAKVIPATFVIFATFLGFQSR